jgi:hypothetical protein
LVVYPAMGYHYRRHGGSLSTDKSADRQALRGMLEANARFCASNALSGRLAAACAQRRRSLEASLRWVDVIEAVRERCFATAFLPAGSGPSPGVGLRRAIPQEAAFTVWYTETNTAPGHWSCERSDTVMPRARRAIRFGELSG